MNRRHLILTAAAALVLPRAALAKPLDYSEGLEKTLLAEGRTLFLDFKAEWCGTCKAQERAINALKDANPDYAARITFVNVDWDKFGNSALSRALKVPRRSTLVVLKGEREIGRLVADTSKSSIKGLMDQALAAATAA